jgi:5-methyltetrahydropteroyltriglutamate--homocysteine methyltransferase
VTTVGSWPRPPEVAEATRAYRLRRIDRAERDGVLDAALVELLRLQETLGCDIVTDGELRRDNFYSFVADKLSGVRIMTLAEMLEVVEDKAGFEQLLQTLDVPAYSISSPICTARIERREPLAAGDVRIARRHTGLPIKATLPGPYLLTRAMFVPELTLPHYADKEALARDVVALLRAELAELRSAVRPGANAASVSTGSSNWTNCAPVSRRTGVPEPGLRVRHLFESSDEHARNGVREGCGHGRRGQRSAGRFVTA